MKKMVIILLLVFPFLFSQTVFAAQPGKTGTVFNKRFIRTIRPMMPYEQLVKNIGAPGLSIPAKKGAKTSVTNYHWDGGKSSALDVRVTGGRVIDATMHAPNGHTYLVGKNGQIKDLGD